MKTWLVFNEVPRAGSSQASGPLADDQERLAMIKPKRHHAASNMTADRYRKLIAKLGLSQRAASRFLGPSDVQSARMALGQSTIPPPVAI